MQSVSTPTVLWRGLTMRCGRCGSRHVTRGYFHLRERCPRCGYRFVREEGFFTGVYLINYSFATVVLVLEILGWAVFLILAERDASIVGPLVMGVATAVILPIIGYPFAATTWAAMDLAMRPLDPVEEAEAATYEARPD